MATYWILAANSAAARLFVREKKFSPPIEQRDWLHPESRLHSRDLEHDRQGKTFSSHGHGQDDNQKHTEPKTREAHDFARELATYLNRARSNAEFESLSIVADPSFLGILREHLDEQTRAHVTREVSKNLTHASAEKIAEAIDSD